MKTFSEFSHAIPEKKSEGFPTFSQMQEAESSCMTENLKNKISEIMSACKEEMLTIHGDESPKTAENWMAEYNSYMEQCMETLQKDCDECMIQKG
jgi:hypothetical protein